MCASSRASSLTSGRSEGAGVNHEAVADIALDHSVPGFIDVVSLNDLNIGHDGVLRCEVEHLLKLCHRANHASRYPATLCQHLKRLDRVGLRSQPHHHEGAIKPEQLEIEVEINGC